MPPAALASSLERCTADSRAWQAAQRERTGFGASAELGELGHVLEELLRGRGYLLSEARWAAHAAAVPGVYNFQGNRRLAANLRVSTRTAQRARARLERDGLIKSYLLAPGDQVEGQRAPVRRHQVVRDVERLQRAARRRLEWLRSGGRVAGTPPSPRAARPRVTADVPRRTPAPAAPAPATAERAPMPPELEHFLATGELPPPSPRRSVQRGGRAPPRGS